MTQKWNIKNIADDVLRDIFETVEGDLTEFEAQVDSELIGYLSPFLDGARSRGIISPLDEAVITDGVRKYIEKIPDLQTYLREHLPDCLGVEKPPQPPGNL